MKMKRRFWIVTKILAVMLSLCVFFGCGGDDFGDDVGENNGSIADSPLDTHEQIPTITIEKVRTEKVERGETVWWRLNAEPAPKTDLAVQVGGDWVIVPKSKNNSETFKNTFFFGEGAIKVEPLPMVSIVGKGLVVDLEFLQKSLPGESLGGHRIPADFDFPLYTVGDPSQVEPEPVPPAANFISASPPGGEIAVNEIITVTFDNAPAHVRVSAGTVTVAGKTATITGPFTPGPLTFTLIWAGGATTLNYWVIAPDITPPRVIGGTVRDGDINVDPGAINADGVIKIFFTELVVGNIALQTEGGDDVGWLGKVESNTGKLELVKGKEIGNGKTYVIVGRVADAAGNETRVRITFVTRIK